MDKLKIAVLDSGFDFFRPLQNQIVYNANFTDEVTPVDQNGHGSCIIKLLDSIGSNLDFYNMVILNKKKTGKISFLKRALAEAISQNVNIINLSVGIEQNIIDSELEDIILQCFEREIFIITTRSNTGMYNHLRSCKNILSIQRQCQDNEATNYPNPQHGTFFVNNMPRIVPWLYDSYKLSGANSFLTPFLIKKIYQINKEYTNFDEIFNVILSLSASDILKIPSNSLYFQRKVPFDKSLLNEVLSYPVISDLYSKDGALLLRNATTRNITRLVQLIETLTNQTYIVDSFWLSDIFFLENLVNKILLIEGTDYE